jgi:TctA family transporter
LVGVAVKVTEVPAQMLFPGLATMLTDGVRAVLITNVELVELVSAGLLDTIRIRKPLAPRVPPGIVTEILPRLAELPRLPTTKGVEKLPRSSDNSAVKTFPILKV